MTTSLVQNHLSPGSQSATGFVGGET
ncbi:hypothetical protein CPAR01_03984 [Colletotrichum paranaense]|uniref:Uncharacterized protein n=3 Tax=Colletotrichum acutatum species complex TaxID=2707335 RepID=A0AAI9Z2K4_9PEZI|nr:hypothetical protein CSPX01_14411 [Colletotrichum filicis]KAK1469022.1 hypothetical protein CMEL01_00789 [Colletotrichum melonis]KAK1530797.1 hypothetical protein CCOS01_05900 [Colletotrichum costaricense]KAK1543351.1 hypothetical protein CPAR01_03984 [Colletotrichum paranaense]